jgi:hypothetical protein
MSGRPELRLDHRGLSTYQFVPWPLLGSVTAMTRKPERTAVAQLWRSVVLGMTLVVLLTVVVVLAAS